MEVCIFNISVSMFSILRRIIDNLVIYYIYMYLFHNKGFLHP
jgi:hypothetical protein